MDEALRDCDICRGARFVRLQRYTRLVAPLKFDTGPGVMASLGTTVAQFPCPQCSVADNVAYERIDVLEEFVEVNEDIRPSRELDNHIRCCLAGRLGDALLKNGHVTVEVGAFDRYRMLRTYRARLGVVARQAVATLEGRVAQRQMHVARELVDAVIEQIKNWGSYYHGRDGGTVGKDQAIDWLRKALEKVKEARAK